MTAGQRAIVVAKMYPDAESVGRGKKGVVSTSFPTVGGLIEIASGHLLESLNQRGFMVIRLRHPDRDVPNAIRLYPNLPRPRLA
jgi:hypothetical protein